jgi:HAD superfamily hydrolase (TIGR01662 family)
LLAERRYVLFDFDGPICAVFGSVSDVRVAEGLRSVLYENGHRVPSETLLTHDPFDVLQYAAQLGTTCAAEVDATLIRWELRAVESAPMTIGIPDTFSELKSTGHVVAVVSNNSEEAVYNFLQRHDLTEYVRAVFGRPIGRPHLLKPSPYLLDSALSTLKATPKDALFIGDSLSDIEAGRAADVPVIAYANKPGKTNRFRSTTAAAIIEEMSEITSSA